MKLKNVFICVSDIETSKCFYKELFGLEVIIESDGNVILTEGLVLQDINIWENELGCKIIHENKATGLYFEENDMDAFIEKLNKYNSEIKIVTPYQVLPWGQKLIRLYDLDGNLIEVRSSN